MENKGQKAPIWLSIICFFVPLVGLIMYATNTSKNKKYANSCGIPGLIGFFVWPIVGVIITVIIFVVLGFGTFALNNSTSTSTRTSTSSSKVSTYSEKNSISVVMASAQLDYSLNKNSNVKTIVRNHFKDYTILDTSSLYGSSGKIKGTMRIRTKQGNRYKVDFTNSTVKAD